MDPWFLVCVLVALALHAVVLGLCWAVPPRVETFADRTQRLSARDIDALRSARMARELSWSGALKLLGTTSNGAVLTRRRRRAGPGGLQRAVSRPTSTFAIDLDAASYADISRFLRQGALPPPSAVRVEELINHFDYQYPEPTGEHPLGVTVEQASCPWKPGHQLVRIGLTARGPRPGVGATPVSVARQVRVQVMFDPLRVESYRLVGHESRLQALVQEHDDGEELAAGQRVTALYEIEPGASSVGDLLRVKVRYSRLREQQSRVLVLPVTAKPRALASASADLRFAAAVAWFGRTLRGESPPGLDPLRSVLELARGACFARSTRAPARLARRGRGADCDGQRGRFLELVRIARRLMRRG